METVEEFAVVPEIAGERPEVAVAPRCRFRVRLPSLQITSSERRWMLVVVDVVAINAALLVALALRFDYVLSLRTRPCEKCGQ